MVSGVKKAVSKKADTSIQALQEKSSQSGKSIKQVRHKEEWKTKTKW